MSENYCYRKVGKTKTNQGALQKKANFYSEPKVY